MRFELAGVPVLHEDDALRAVRAAADLLEEIAILNERLEAELGLAVSVRMGVNTGQVVTDTGERLQTGMRSIWRRGWSRRPPQGKS